MSIEQDEAAIQALLLSCGMDKEEVKETPTIIQRENYVRPLKYLKFEKEMTKEEKYVKVITEILKVVDIDFLKDMKDDNWFLVSYSRPYGNSNGGPVIHLGYELEGTKRERFGEINNRFPIFKLCTELRAKYNIHKAKTNQAA